MGKLRKSLPLIILNIIGVVKTPPPGLCRRGPHRAAGAVATAGPHKPEPYLKVSCGDTGHG